jgi:hypothetical protein
MASAVEIVIVFVLIVATVGFMAYMEHRDLTSQEYTQGYFDGHSEHNVTKYQDMQILFDHADGMTTEHDHARLYERGYINGYYDSVIHSNVK